MFHKIHMKSKEIVMFVKRKYSSEKLILFIFKLKSWEILLINTILNKNRGIQVIDMREEFSEKKLLCQRK